MHLEISVSERVAAWLERQAAATGTNAESVAAGVLETAITQNSGQNGAKPADADRWLDRFREFVRRVPERAGPAVDARRDSIYD